MNWHERVTELAAAKRLAALAGAVGAKYGPILLRHSASEWRQMMRSDANYRCYGTLRFLLENARERWENEPTVAHQITSVVLDFVDSAEGPSHIHGIALRGLAQKEHANACQAVGDLRVALAAAERSVEIYGEASSLLFDQTRARLVVCKVLREMGDVERAMQLARECAATFTDFGDLPFANMARMFEAGVLFTSKRFSEALDISRT